MDVFGWQDCLVPANWKCPSAPPRKICRAIRNAPTHGCVSKKGGLFMSAKNKLRAHFLSNLGRVLSSKELSAIGGTTEWARRVRELRQGEGYQILTHNDLASLKPGEYLLKEPKPIPAFESQISKELRALVLDRNGLRPSRYYVTKDGLVVMARTGSWAFDEHLVVGGYKMKEPQ